LPVPATLPEIGRRSALKPATRASSCSGAAGIVRSHQPTTPVALKKSVWRDEVTGSGPWQRQTEAQPPLSNELKAVIDKSQQRRP
jgi:hypothetical protein